MTSYEFKFPPMEPMGEEDTQQVHKEEQEKASSSQGEKEERPKETSPGAVALEAMRRQKELAEGKAKDKEENPATGSQRGQEEFI